MRTPGQAYLSTVLTASEAPCVSIYQKTHRMHPENAQDTIRFKNFVKEVEESLEKGYPTREVRAMLEPLHALLADADFWNHTLDGIVVLASPTRFDVFTVPRDVPNLVVVADSFHLKPLMRYVQSADRFHVLAIAEDKFSVYEGNRYHLDPIHTPKLPGGTRPPASSDPRAEVVVGEGMAGYFRAVDHTVTEEVSKHADIPMVLAALPENVTPFRHVAKNPHLLADTLLGDPFAFEVDDLRKGAWAIAEKYYLARLSKLSEDFTTAQSRQLGTSDLSDAARAAVAGRIGTVLIDADQVQPGKIDHVTGAIQADELADPKVDDKLDDLAELVLKTGGHVVIVPSDRMPSKTGLAAIYRY